VENLSHAAHGVQPLFAQSALARNASAATRQPGNIAELPFPAPLPKPELAPKVIAEGITDFGQATDAACFLLADVQCPPEHRAFVDCLIGVAGGRVDWFEASDEIIAMRAAKSCKWVQRHRDEFDAWQRENLCTLIEVRDNFTDAEGKRHPHRYRVHISRLAVETMLEARLDSLAFQKNPGLAIERAARAKRDSVPNMPPRQRRGRKREPDAETTINKNLKMAATLIGNAAKLVSAIELNRAAGSTMLPFQLDAELIANVEREVKSLSALLPSLPLSSTLNTLLDTGGEAGGASDESVKGDGSEPRADLAPCVLPLPYAKPSAPGHIPPSGHFVHLETSRFVEVLEETTLAPIQSKGEAVEHIELFESVGAVTFDVTMRDEESGRASLFETVDGRAMRSRLPAYLARNDEGESLIARPHGTRELWQVDDAPRDLVEQLAEFAFEAHETSPGNYQIWLAPEGTPGEIAAAEPRFFARIADTGANRGGRGATRLAGSLNQKPGRASFPVCLVHRAPGRLAEVAELGRAAWLAPEPEPSPEQTRVAPVRSNEAEKSLPDYRQCLAERGGDRSRADFLFSLRASRQGFTEEEIAAALRAESDKARARRDRYAERTARKAAQIVAAS
jgi:hypothetical protein